jgi:citrate synthase
MKSEESNDYLSAGAAAGMLGVKLATLYAYTSRGLVESIPGERGRARLYRRRDIDRLKARRDARAGHGPVAAAALRFGEPVLDSAITAISLDVGPIYRGHIALELARDDVPFEAVAEILWTDRVIDVLTPGELEPLWCTRTLGLPVADLQALLPPQPPPLAALAAVIPLLAALDPGRFAERPEAVIPRARTLIRRMVASLALSREADDVESAVRDSLQAPSIAGGVAAALGADGGAAGVAALNRALVLGADHEAPHDVLGFGRVLVQHHEAHGSIAGVDPPEPDCLRVVRLGDRLGVARHELPLVLGHLQLEDGQERVRGDLAQVHALRAHRSPP